MASPEVKVLSENGNKLVLYSVDGNSGQVTGTDNQPVEKYFTRLDVRIDGNGQIVSR